MSTARPRSGARHLAFLIADLNVGGVQKTTLSLAGALALRGNRVDLVVLKPGGALSDQVPENVRTVELRPAMGLSARLRAVLADPMALPKAIADQYGIVPGDEIEFQAAGDFIRIVPPRARAKRSPRLSLEERLRLFDAATERLRRLQSSIPAAEPGTDRGWKREDLYTRGEPR